MTAALVKATIRCAWCGTVDTWDLGKTGDLAMLVERFRIKHFHCEKQKGPTWPPK